jgi:hypothetical protein
LEKDKTMALFEGTCIGKPVSVEFGADNQGRPRVRWEMEVTQGPHKGKRARYSGKLDPENIKWTKRDMKAIGWKGVSSKTFLEDVAKANVEIEFEAQIASHDGREWTAAKMTGALPLAKLDERKLAEVDQWFAEAEDVAPQPNGASPRRDDDSIPF